MNSNYLYIFSTILTVLCLLYFYLNSKSNKNILSNKILLKNLLESLDLDLPDELKQLDSTSSDPQKSS